MTGDHTNVQNGDLPPGPPISGGALATVLALRPVPFLEACAARHGSHFTLRLGRGRSVVVSSEPDLVRELLEAGPDLACAGAGREAMPLVPLLGTQSLLVLDGGAHERQRKLVVPTLRGERVEALTAAVAQATREEVERWPAEATFASLPAMRRITLQVILRAVFGAEDPIARAQLATALTAVLDFATRPLTALRLELSDPARAARRNPWCRFRWLIERLDRVVREQIAVRRRDPRVAERKDVLSTLLVATDAEGQGLTDQELRDQLVSLAVTGHEKTATALSWALERITSSPGVLASLTEQAEEVPASYLEATIAETLRLRPVVPALARRLTRDAHLGSLQLPAGTVVAPSIYLLHRRADLYPDPALFLPERFLSGPPDPAAWVPFGGGPRRCVGAGLVQLQMAGILGQILKTVELRPALRRPERVRRRAVTWAPRQGGRIAVGSQRRPRHAPRARVGLASGLRASDG